MKYGIGVLISKLMSEMSAWCKYNMSDGPCEGGTVTADTSLDTDLLLTSIQY